MPKTGTFRKAGSARGELNREAATFFGPGVYAQGCLGAEA